MSIARNQRKVAKEILLFLRHRIIMARRRDPMLSARAIFSKMERVAFDSGSQQWRRWYRENKKYQARLAAVRRQGGDVSGLPTALKRSWVQ